MQPLTISYVSALLLLSGGIGFPQPSILLWTFLVMLLCLLSIFDRNWSSQVKFWLNWGCHNYLKFEKQVPNHIQPQNLLTSVINISASNSKPYKSFHIRF